MQGGPRNDCYHSFKSCPRVGGIFGGPAARPLCVAVSSRAPVWGASSDDIYTDTVQLVSSRAPVWGASSVRSAPPREARTFQVVPPCGGHPGPILGSGTGQGVSSRAPVWGASQSTCGSGTRSTCFKSCPRVGGILHGLKRRPTPPIVSSRAPVWGAS